MRNVLKTLFKVLEKSSVEKISKDNGKNLRYYIHGTLKINFLDDGSVSIQDIKRKSIAIFPLDPDAIRIKSSDEPNRFI